MPQRLATSATIAPGCIASATIRHFCSSDQLRRRSPRVTTSTTSLRALMCAVVWVLAASTSTSISASVLNGSATRHQRRGVSLDGAATTRTFDQTIHAEGSPIDAAFFVETGMVSLIVTLEGGDEVEAGIAGPEGMIGLPLVYGDSRSLNSARVQMEGTALRIG